LESSAVIASVFQNAVFIATVKGWEGEVR